MPLILGCPTVSPKPLLANLAWKLVKFDDEDTILILSVPAIIHYECVQGLKRYQNKTQN